MDKIKQLATNCLSREDFQRFDSYLSAVPPEYLDNTQLYSAFDCLLFFVQVKDKDIRAQNELLQRERYFTGELISSKDRQIDQIQHDKNVYITLLQSELARADEQMRIVKEKDDILTDMFHIAGSQKKHPAGSVTRSDLWNNLKRKDGVKSKALQLQVSELSQRLTACFSELDLSKWQEEKDMYEPIVNAINLAIAQDHRAMNTATSRLLPIDCSVNMGSRTKISFPYFSLYVIEFKLPTTGNLLSPENCGQVLDYILNLHAGFQPDRYHFLAILSNFTEASVFKVDLNQKTGEVQSVERMTASSLAQAIDYCERYSPSDFQPLPLPPEELGPCEIIQATPRHIVYSLRSPSLTEPTPAFTVHDSSQKRAVAVKIAKDPEESRSIAHEISILRQLQSLNNKSIPSLVFSDSADPPRYVALSPVGKVLDRPPPTLWRAIVPAVIDALQFLHNANIIHRDIRRSNIVYDDQGLNIQVIIIDYEKAVSRNKSVPYEGGAVCWPRRLLIQGSERYCAEPRDDLDAVILLVLNALHPAIFAEACASQIGLDQSTCYQTRRLLELWKRLQNSVIWSPYVVAAENEDYKKLKDIAEFFQSF